MKKIQFNNFKFGVSPNIWKNELFPIFGLMINLPKIMKESIEAGYSGLEFCKKFIEYPSLFEEETLKESLPLIAGKFWSNILTDYEETFLDFKKYISYFKKIKTKRIIVVENYKSIQSLRGESLFNTKIKLNQNEWQELADKLNAMGEYAKDEGIELIYHPQIGTIIQDLEDIRKLLELTIPEYVGLVFDTGNLAALNENVVSLIDEFYSRIQIVHLKDVELDVILKMKKNDLDFYNGILMGMFPVPGKGSIDFFKILEKFKKYDYNKWMIVSSQQDPSEHLPLKSAVFASDYLKQIIEKLKNN